MTCQTQNSEQQTAHSCCQSETVNAQQSESTSSPQSYATVRPRVELRETQQGYVIRAEMPGVSKQNVGITIENDLLTLSGEPGVVNPSESEVVYREFHARRYERTFRISEEVDRKAVKATMNAGLLVVTLPKLPAAQPLKVEVTAE